VTLFNHDLVSKAKLCLVSVFPYIAKDCPKMRNLPKIFLRSFENVGPGVVVLLSVCDVAVGNRHQAAQCTSTYLLFRPDDDTMLYNKQFYLQQADTSPNDFAPRQVITDNSCCMTQYDRITIN